MASSTTTAFSDPKQVDMAQVVYEMETAGLQSAKGRMNIRYGPMKNYLSVPIVGYTEWGIGKFVENGKSADGFDIKINGPEKNVRIREEKVNNVFTNKYIAYKIDPECIEPDEVIPEDQCTPRTVAFIEAIKLHTLLFEGAPKYLVNSNPKLQPAIQENPFKFLRPLRRSPLQLMNEDAEFYFKVSLNDKPIESAKGKKIPSTTIFAGKRENNTLRKIGFYDAIRQSANSYVHIDTCPTSVYFMGLGQQVNLVVRGNVLRFLNTGIDPATYQKIHKTLPSAIGDSLCDVPENPVQQPETGNQEPSTDEQDAYALYASVFQNTDMAPGDAPFNKTDPDAKRQRVL